MKKLIIVLAIFISVFSGAKAQDYENAIGLRGGLFSGLTFKHFISNKAALEGLLETRWGGFNITGLYEVHANAFDVDRLNWYYGAGANIGFYSGKNTPWGTLGTSYSLIGIDGILGIEYNIPDIPINISIDCKPVLSLVGYTDFWADGAAISIRYIF